MRRVINSFKKIDQFLLRFPEELQWGTTAIAALLLLLQISTATSFLVQRSDTRAIVQATDNDAGWAIGTALHTHWLNDNHFRAYGPTYYRISTLLHSLFGNPLGAKNLNSLEQKETNRHFLLQWISLLSLVGLCFLLISVFFNSWFYRLWGTSLLFAAFTVDPTWVYMIYRVHPDHLFTALITASFAFFIRFLDQSKRSDFIAGAVFWGLAASTKLTLTLFAPSLVVLFYKKELKDFKVFLKYSLATYFLVGFPQSLALGGVFEFLWQQKRNVLRGDLEFVKIWQDLFFNQLKWPLLVSTVIMLLTPLGARIHLKASVIKILLLAGLPTLFLFTRRITSAYDYYPLPFVAVLVLAYLYVLQSVFLNLKFWPSLQTRRPWIYQAALLLGMPWLVMPVSQSFQPVLESQLRCAPEARKVELLVHAAAAKGESVLVDPYIPYSEIYHDKEVFMAWEMNLSLLKPNTTLIALKKDYYCIYLTAEDGGCPGVVDHIKNWDETRKFYRLFFNKEETTIPDNQSWKKVYKDECGWEIWKKDGS